MNISDLEWKSERERLAFVLMELRKQLEEKSSFMNKMHGDAVMTQKELWQEIGSVSISNELDQLVDFMSFINTMKAQKRSHEFTARQQEKFEKMLQSPYFGRIDFQEDGTEAMEKCYIGMSNLIDKDFSFLIYDWRAPISSMFYDHETGVAGYDCPEGRVNGKLALKRQYNIKNESIEYMFDSNLKIDDEILQDMLGRSADGKMKTIVTTIQREQNRIIRNETFRNLIVQGPAGSGKTSVALHRIAYLLYRHREDITARNIIIFSPNHLFNDYISNVLPELGEDNICQTTFKDFMHSSLGSGYSLEEQCEMMEYMLTAKGKLAYKDRIGNIRYKSSAAFMEILKSYACHVDKAQREFADIRLRDVTVVTAAELMELFQHEYGYLPLKRRLGKIKERILFLMKPHEKSLMEAKAKELWSSGDYVSRMEVNELSMSSIRNEMRETYHAIERMTHFDLYDIYRELFESPEFFPHTIEGMAEGEMDAVRRYTLDNLKSHRIYYEDQPPLLYLKDMLGDLPRTADIKYVIIDEAQDYTPLQYEIFRQLFSHAGITMLGDLNQSINPHMNLGNYSSVLNIFPKDETGFIRLTKSYRSTLEIAGFAGRLLRTKVENDHECVERSGEKPLVMSFPDEEGIQMQIVKDIKSSREAGYRSIGIITASANESRQVFSFLKDKETLGDIVSEDDEYTDGTLVIPAYLAKGLEFDVVLIYNAGNGNYDCEEERLLLYTACTRALHVLHIYYSGTCSTLLQEALDNKACCREQP